MAREGIVRKRGQHVRVRLFPHTHGPAPHNHKNRVESAQQRQAAWSKLTPEAQLTVLDGRPGNSTRQRARLQAQIDKRHLHVQPTVESSETPPDNKQPKRRQRK